MSVSFVFFFIKVKWIEEELKKVPLLEFSCDGDVDSWNWTLDLNEIEFSSTASAECIAHPDMFLKRGDHVRVR